MPVATACHGISHYAGRPVSGAKRIFASPVWSGYIASDGAFKTSFVEAYFLLIKLCVVMIDSGFKSGSAGVVRNIVP